jgi:hypothetical protein
MARSKILKMYWTSATTGSAATSLVIPQNGVITSVAWGLVGKAGAGVDGVLMYELSTASISTITTNDTPGNSIDTATGAANISGGTWPTFMLKTVLAIPVAAGDRLYIHCYASGTAVATLAGECHVALS